MVRSTCIPKPWLSCWPFSVYGRPCSAVCFLSKCRDDLWTLRADTVCSPERRSGTWITWIYSICNHISLEENNLILLKKKILIWIAAWVSYDRMKTECHPPLSPVTLINFLQTSWRNVFRRKVKRSYGWNCLEMVTQEHTFKF